MTEAIKTISTKNENYPELLKKIKNPPKTIYYRGELKNNEKCFAIVGTRRCSDYGKQVALEIAGDLAEAGLIIVSGLAPGIDTLAHQATVERSKRTIAVLGTGIDKKTIYPQSNLGLADRILAAGGCIMSEYPEGTRGTNFSFPQRNRIVSGMSQGVLVVEAKEKSGSLITADLARKQGKKLFAVPGPVHSLNSRGTNYLIKKGFAKLVENANDILKELNLSLKVEKDERPGDNPQENLILKVLGEGGLDINKIIAITKLSPSEISGNLAILEIKNKIRNLGKNIYAINNSRKSD
jgi:DNA processing protein